MRIAPLVVISLALVGKTAAADRFAPAADLSIGKTGTIGDLSQDGSAYLRFGAGVQYGRVALLLHLDATSLTPSDPTLDSPGLSAYGKGAGLRVEVMQRKDVYMHVTAGYSWWHLSGSDDVRRGCSTFGTCDAGFYREVPDYHDSAPWVALAFGVRTHHRIYPGFGGELGLAPMKIDRSGDAPDDNGVVVWFGVNVTLGGD